MNQYGAERWSVGCTLWLGASRDDRRRGTSPLCLFEGCRPDLARVSVVGDSGVFGKHGTIVEKYDVVRRASDLRGQIVFGYRSNEAGFGWTNPVFTALEELPPPTSAPY
jgi:Trehalase